MVRKQGDRLKQSETKSNIIKYILGKQGPVSEPEIRKHLGEKYGIKDQGRINRHLHELKKVECIELIPPIKTGLSNKWDITKTEHLENIQIKFEDIKLNEFEKSLIVILRESNLDIDRDLDGLECFFELLLSTSFFNACMDIGLEKLQNRAWELYLYDRGFERNKNIKQLLKNCYDTNIKKNPNFIKISEETFRKIMEEIVRNKNSWNVENPISETLEEKYPNEAKEIYEKTKEIWILMTKQKLIFLDTRYHLLFKHYFHQDILNDIVTSDEIEFAMKIKENQKESSVLVRYFKNLILISEYVVRYKKPTFFNVNGTPNEVLKEIIDFYKLDYSTIPDEIKKLIETS
ncbi:hypothetical protein [Methanosarcina sp.]|jgi:hypothetical protein|uniref:hypothetical protein n=1 Tax=Methanosarcina sp. TaxID=2213 RepID=UPI002BE1AFD4|nr:hypothetical protein [Methanosarcina sp.]HOW14327.1 hypothetical protein [Methanosarcina sp.]